MTSSSRTAYFCKFITAFLFSFVFFSAKAQGFLKASGKNIIDSKGQPVLLRGIGLGGWMLQEGYMLRVTRDAQQHRIRERIDSLIGPKLTEEFYETWLNNFVTKRDVDSLHAWGFNSIRLPMHYNLFTLPVASEPVAGEQTWLTKGFQLTDSLLSWCKANKMYLILDMHAAPGGQGNDLNIADRDPSKPSLWESEANKQKMIMLWTRLAQRYANETWIGGYDIINEPNWGFSDLQGDKNGLKEQGNQPLRELMVNITKAIRSVDKNHIIIIEGNGWGNNYNGIMPAWDNNMVLSFHKYWNYNDTASIGHIIKMRQQYNIPVWLGETGENSNVWFTQAIQLLEQNNIGWAWWPLKKMGANNPLEIPTNLNYNQILNYWSGRGRKPNESNAYSGLLELATYARIENNIIHRDVIDAMFRQTKSAQAIPYKQNVVKAGSTIQAVDYDLGRNGVAYYDRDTADYHVSQGSRGGNRGRIYRNDGVDIRKDSSAYEKYYVSDIEDGEWLQYTVSLPAAANVDLVFKIAADTASSLRVSIDNKPFGNELALEAAASPSRHLQWQTAVLKGGAIAAGRHTIRIQAIHGGFLLSSFTFQKR